MDNALGQPQTIVLLGGTSDIGVEIVRRLLGPTTRRVVLACRDLDHGHRRAVELHASIEPRRTNDDPLRIDVVRFDADAPDTHGVLARELATGGDIDLVIAAFGLLGDPAVTSRDPVAAAQISDTNFTGAVSSAIVFANVLRDQGHGSLVLLSSVAGERVRTANPVYGATKAGIDAFFQALGDTLAGEGVHVMIVRPGFVHTSMTTGMPAAPLSTTAEKVAAATVRGLRTHRRIVWAPGVLRYVFIVLRHLPTVVWRRLPLG